MVVWSGVRSVGVELGESDTAGIQEYSGRTAGAIEQWRDLKGTKRTRSKVSATNPDVGEWHLAPCLRQPMRPGVAGGCAGCGGKAADLLKVGAWCRSLR